jgi:hypothetical protein
MGVREGRIRDPETIRSIAQRFNLLAQEPEMSASIAADLAAEILNSRATMYEEAGSKPEKQ